MLTAYLCFTVFVFAVNSIVSILTGTLKPDPLAVVRGLGEVALTGLGAWLVVVQVTA